MLVVTVAFQLADGALDAFRSAILDNAANSLREPGCRRFDVAFSPDGTRCFLYELYDDDAAFAFHRATPHFKRFNDSSGALIKAKTLETFALEPNPGAPKPRS